MRAAESCRPRGSAGFPSERRRPDRPGDEKGSQGTRVRRLFTALGRIGDLRRERKRLYARSGGLKKAWYGHLAKLELRLAKPHGAVVVRENLTVETLARDDPDYRNPTFNKRINTGAKGQYPRRSSAKLLWDGVPEIAVNSGYTSRACTVHSQVMPKGHRKGGVLRFDGCGRRNHADLHAAETLALVPCLVKRMVTNAPAPRKGRGSIALAARQGAMRMRAGRVVSGRRGTHGRVASETCTVVRRPA